MGAAVFFAAGSGTEAPDVMVKARSASALQIADDPAYRSLRNDPHFLRLQQTIGVSSRSS